jgi:hypothetical protein
MNSTTKELEFHYLFSVCTIVNNENEYHSMKKSFEEAGFIDNTEYLVADNTKSNAYDAYAAINYFRKNAKGRYTVIVHQDVACIDNAATLLELLNTLEQQDPKWAICGNAGSNGYHQGRIYITNGGKLRKTTPLPARVTSLDENLLILNNKNPVDVSNNIHGFHLYGTDICLQAAMAGFTCYVIPFMVKHFSLGNLKDLDSFIPLFIKSYENKMTGRFVETSCAKFYLGGTADKNKFYNKKSIFFFSKLRERIKELYKNLFAKVRYKTTVTIEE